MTTMMKATMMMSRPPPPAPTITAMSAMFIVCDGSPSSSAPSGAADVGELDESVVGCATVDMLEDVVVSLASPVNIGLLSYYAPAEGALSDDAV